MRIENDIITLLLNDASITDEVGERVYPMRLSANQTFPAITIQRISKAMNARSRDSVMNSPVLQITVWDESYSKVSEIAEILLNKLDGFSKELTTGLVTIFQVSDTTLYDPDSKLFYEPLDFEVNYEKERVS